MNKPQTYGVMFLLDILYLGNRGGAQMTEPWPRLPAIPA